MIPIVDIGRNEKSWAGFEAEKARQERRRCLLIRRQINWYVRKYLPEDSAFLRRHLQDHYAQIARRYMGLG